MKKHSLLLLAVLVSLFITTACVNQNQAKPNGGQSSENITKSVVTVEEAFEIIKQNEGNSSFVLLDVRTNAEYNEGHLKNVMQHDFYATDFDEWLLKLDKEKRFLVYCRTDNRSAKAFNKLKDAQFPRIQYMKGGFTEWANKGYPIEKPEYKKILDVYVTSDKIKTNGAISFNFSVTDLDDNPIRKSSLSLQLLSNNAEIEKKDIVMDDHGKGTHSFDLQAQAKGRYRLVCTAKKDNYEAGCAYYDFEFADQDEAVGGTSGEITLEADITDKLAKKFYNRNIYGYKLYDRTQKLVALGDSVVSGPALVLFISPSCLGCMEKAQTLVKYDLSKITLVPVITSVDENLAKGIEKTEAQLKGLGLESIIPTSLYDSKDALWFSRFKFSTTPKFILINKEGQIKDIIHGSENLKIETVLEKMEKIFNLPKFTNKGAILKQLAEFEKGTSLTIKDQKTTLLSELNSLDTIKQKIDFSYSDYNLILKSFSHNTGSNSLKLTYQIEYKNDAQYKTGIITQDFYGFKKEDGGEGDDLQDEITEMNNILADHGYFNASDIQNITLEEFGEEHIINDCTQYGYKVVVIKIDKNYEENKATLHYYIQKNTNPKVRTENKTCEFSNFLILTEEQKKVKEMLKDFEGVSLNDVNVENSLRLFGKSIAQVELTTYVSSKKEKVKDILNDKPAIVGIGFFGCPGCQQSWRNIAEFKKSHSGFEVIELLTPTPTNKDDFLAYLRANDMEELKDHFYYGYGLPHELKPYSQYVPIFMVVDKEGLIKPAPNNLNVAFKMLKSLIK